MTLDELKKKAQALLRANDRGGYTVPAPKLYPHQWNWDSAFCALGFMHFDPRRAASELTLLCRGQWADGLLPHIIFNAQAEHYEPGPKAWETVGARGAPNDVRTTSITQPPVAATAALRVLRRSGGDAQVEAALRQVVTTLERWHAWFLSTRDPKGHGSPAIVHPWESGMDNAPRWDAAMARIAPGNVEYKRVDNTLANPDHRPTRYDYDRYFFIVQERARRKFAPPDPTTEPLLVQDVALTSLLCQAEGDLLELGRALGVPTPGASRRQAALGHALRTHHFDVATGRYHDYDVKLDQKVATEHIARFFPLFAGIPDSAQVEQMVGELADPALYGTPWPHPTVPPGDAKFEGQRYWRGPAWVNVNWIIWDALVRSKQAAWAERLKARTLEMIRAQGFREYFHPVTGEGLGAENFSWTAALALDMLAR